MSVSDEDMKNLLNEVYELSGYDFSSYSEASLKRRIQRIYDLNRFRGLHELLRALRHKGDFMKHFVEEITVNVTEMFRDPSFYKTLRHQVLPLIGSKPFIRVWHAGCSTGEEVYSMAILLHEAGLLRRSLIYATDINPEVLEKARKGIFPLSQMRTYSQNYLASGGLEDFSSYYTASYTQVKFSETLAEKMIFSTHNLVSDGSFNSFDIIVCRNVLIYFNKELQDKVFRLFDESLEPLSFLALGTKETIRFSGIAHRYKQTGTEKIWRKTA